MNKVFLTAALAASVLGANAQNINVTWQTLGNKTVDDKATYTQRFTVEADRPFAGLAFNQFAKPMHAVNPADTVIEIIPGYYVIESPRFAKIKKGEKVTVDVLTYGVFRMLNMAPDGVHGVSLKGEPTPAEFTRLSLIASHDQWADDKYDRMPYGKSIYNKNEKLKSDYQPSVYDVLPSYKSVKLTGGTSAVPMSLDYEPMKGDHPEWYRITVKDGRALLQCEPSVRRQTEHRFLRNTVGRGLTELPNAVIEDWPDNSYRALMIDNARNYLTKAELFRIIDMMVDYGFNTLHFHFAEDEAWRVDLPSLPELAEVAGGRGYTRDEKDFLAQVYNGNGDPTATGISSNGYLSRQDFIDLLQYADKWGIQVLPEVDSPGHSRASIKAMEKRCRVTGDERWRLVDPADTSKYTSAQDYHDCVMNPAMPGSYLFMETIARDLIELYKEAGVNLPAVHIGGDEVPGGAWSGSPIAQKFMAEKGFTTERQLHAYFVERICDIFAGLGLKISGWQEIAVGHSEAYDAHVAPNVYSVNFWHPAPKDANESTATYAARKGYPVVLSNADLFYMDIAYSNHPDERGLTWSGVVDEFKSLSGCKSKLCTEPILGASGQLFGETLRGDYQAEAYLLPKALGLAERAWNSEATYSNAQLQSIITNVEIPQWEREGYNYHLRQPGIRITDGVVEINNPYGVGEVHYTIDGSNPDATSPLYSEPFKTDAEQVRAVLLLNGKQSVITLSDPKK
jgi:hexosaminidase